MRTHVWSLDFAFAVLQLVQGRRVPSSLYTSLSMRRTPYRDDALARAVACSSTLRQVIERLGLVPAGGNYATVKRHIARLGLSTSHFTRPRSVAPRPATPTAILLSSSSAVQSYKLKRRLLREGLLEARCATCGGTRWQDQPMPLELHHRDGDRRNNVLDNLALLCPNCHALTDSYKGRNIGKV